MKSSPTIQYMMVGSSSSSFVFSLFVCVLELVMVGRQVVVCGLRHLNKNMEGWINYKTKSGEI